MQDTLALKYRPQRFDELAGQPGASVVLAAMVAKNSVPSALLFHGPRGSGKTSAARILAAALNCTVIDPAEVPCGRCDSCVAVRTSGSPDVIEVDAASNGTAEQMAHLCDLVSYSIGGRHRVVILDEAHGLSRAAFDKLLKTLEEPPPYVVFVLVTTEPVKIPGTISSRCTSFAFRRIGPAKITERLGKIRAEEGLQVSDELLGEISERADGALRDAIMLLDQCVRADVSDIAGFEKMTGVTDFAPSLVAAMAGGDYGRLYACVDELMNEIGDPALITARTVTCLVDLLRLGAGYPITSQGAGLAARQRLAAALPVPRVVQAMKVLWGLQQVRGIGQRSALDLAVLVCAEALRPSGGQVQAASNGHRPATIGELEAIGAGALGG